MISKATCARWGSQHGARRVAGLNAAQCGRFQSSRWTIRPCLRAGVPSQRAHHQTFPQPCYESKQPNAPRTQGQVHH